MTEGPRIGVVGLPGSWSTEALADAVARRTGFRAVINVAECRMDLGGGSVWFGDLDLCQLDALLIKKIGENYTSHMLDRLELLRYVSQRGVSVFSNPVSILRLLDRLSCTVTLAGADVPMPPTTVTEDVEQAAAAVEGYGEAVLKPLYSTKARGMQVVRAGDADLRQTLESYRSAGNEMIYVQKKLSIPDRDLGVVFLGGQYVGTYARVKSGEAWNTTTRDGGRYEKHEASPAIVELAHRAQSLFSLDLTSVDVVETTQGPLVFEVSAFGGFRGSQVALGVDLADRYAEYAVQRARR